MFLLLDWTNNLETKPMFPFDHSPLKAMRKMEQMWRGNKSQHNTNHLYNNMQQRDRMDMQLNSVHVSFLLFDSCFFFQMRKGSAGLTP